MTAFAEIDLSAPKFKPKLKNVLGKKLYKDFLKEHPEHKGLTLKEFKAIVVEFNGQLRETAINRRDGIALPERLGFIIVVKCDRALKSIDFDNSKKYKKLVSFRNLDSDDYLAKIAYTNYSVKYSFTHREIWKFQPVRQFRARVSKTFKDHYTKYFHLTKMNLLSDIYKKK